MTGRGGSNGGRRGNGPKKAAPPRDNGRPSPHNVEAEESLLGAALLSRDALEVLATRIRPEDFYRPNNGHIAAALAAAFEAGEKADPVAIADRLGRQQLLDDVGGLGALMSLQANTPASSNAATYARIIHDHATLRRLIGSADEIANLGYGIPEDVHQAVEQAQLLLSDVASNNGNRTYSTLQFSDVAALIAGGIPIVEADFLERSDGRKLFYAGRMHFLQGEPSSGKSWLALVGAVEVLKMGGAVLYLDYEDSDRGIIGRLIALGAEPADLSERFCYVRPEGAFGPSERVELQRHLDQLNPDMAVIDGVAEALVREGASEDRNSEVITWVEKMPRWLAHNGAAVVLLDHVRKPQPGETSTRYARGAGAKLAAVDGAAYELKIARSFSRHRAGSIRVVVAKDRPGGVGAIGQTIAVAHIKPTAGGETVHIRLEPPDDADDFTPTRVMEMVSRELEQSLAPMPVSLIKKTISAKPDAIEKAIAKLHSAGHIELQPGRGLLYTSAQPYRAPDEHHVEPPEQPEQRDLTDVGLFGDVPNPTTDELAERRRRKQEQDPHDET